MNFSFKSLLYCICEFLRTGLSAGPEDTARPGGDLRPDRENDFHRPRCSSSRVGLTSIAREFKCAVAAGRRPRRPDYHCPPTRAKRVASQAVAARRHDGREARRELVR